MGPKLFAGLALLTLVTTAAAVVVALGQPSATSIEYVNEPAFPELRANPDAVAKVTIEMPDGTFSLVRQSADRWVAPDRFDYPVDGADVRELIVALADMRLVEPKTSRPELYDRLELQDLDAEGAKSKLVRLENAEGEVLAEALIGKERARLTGLQSSGTYIRRPGEAQTWLTSGSVRPQLQIEDWLDDEVVALQGENIRRVEVMPAQGEGYAIVRDAKGGDLRLEGLAENEQMKPNADLGRLANALSSVRMEDVRPRDDVDWPDAQPRARFVTFDGLQVTVRLAKIGEEHFATFDAEQVEPVAASPDGAEAAGEPAAESAGGTSGEAAGTETAEATAKPAGPEGSGNKTAEAASSGSGSTAEAPEESASDASQDEAAEETASSPEEDEPDQPDAETLQARVGQWAYKIPEFLYNRLTTARTDFVEFKDGTS